jgi:predicted small lipoprotein YifL
MWPRRHRRGQSGWKSSENKVEIRISLQFHDRVALALAGQSLYGAARFGDLVVKSHLRPTAHAWAVVVLSVVAISLGGCGRKGALDLPPSASGANAAVAEPAAQDTEQEAANKGSVFNPTYGTDAPPAAAKGTKRPFILDPLLDERRP